MMRGITFLAAVTLTLFLAGCPSIWQNEVADKPPSPEKLFSEAEAKFKQKEYKDAVDSYQRLKSAFPDFKKMPEVYMKIADGSYELGEYDKAISRYSQFMELYPGDANVPRAKYQIAMCFFNQIKGTDLDNSVVTRAADAFRVLAQDPNAGDWSKKAEEKLRECQKKLAEKELYKARTYISMGNYQAAKLAAQRVLDQYPKLGLDQEADALVKRCKDKLPASEKETDKIKDDDKDKEKPKDVDKDKKEEKEKEKGEDT